MQGSIRRTALQLNVVEILEFVTASALLRGV